MKGRKSGAVWIFVGALLIVIFAVGMAVDKNPNALSSRYRYDMALEMFGVFCSRIWLPAGLIGIPLFLVSLIISLIREKKSDKEQEP